MKNQIYYKLKFNFLYIIINKYIFKINFDLSFKFYDKRKRTRKRRTRSRN